MASYFQNSVYPECFLLVVKSLENTFKLVTYQRLPSLDNFFQHISYHEGKLLGEAKTLEELEEKFLESYGLRFSKLEELGKKIFFCEDTCPEFISLEWLDEEKLAFLKPLEEARC